MTFDFEGIIGKKVIALKCFSPDRRKKKNIKVQYIVFDDKETYIELNDPDYPLIDKYAIVFQDTQAWELLMNDRQYKDSTIDP